MSVNPNMANREVCNLILADYKTKAPLHVMDYANVTTTEITGETEFAYGGQGHPRRIAFYGEKGGTIAVETQIQPFKLYSIMSGAAIATSASFIKRVEVTTTTETPTITLDPAPATGSPVNVFLSTDDCGTPIKVTVAAGVVTLNTPTPGKYVIYYLESLTTSVKKLNIKATTFPKALTIFAETYNKTEDDEILPYKMIAYKCQPQNNFSITNSNSGDPATLTFTCDLLADSDDNLLDMILIEDTGETPVGEGDDE